MFQELRASGRLPALEFAVPLGDDLHEHCLSFGRLLDFASAADHAALAALGPTLQTA